jgi:tetratricopeptide (TPR) repeat protein
MRKIVNVDKPDPDPVKELARLIKLGKDAFASGEFGAASEQFDRAIAVAPKNALPLFLKAQAAFAAGRYDDAVKDIRAGLAVDPNWPSSPFDPKELYGSEPGTFNDHLATLRGVVAANPREPALEFLLGYELWFIGEKVEAKKWFDLAEKRLPAPGPIALFK